LGEVKEREAYEALDWLLERQQRRQSEVAEPNSLATTVRAADPRPEDQTAIDTNVGAISFLFN
jgi:hypothetical protein